MNDPSVVGVLEALHQHRVPMPKADGRTRLALHKQEVVDLLEEMPLSALLDSYHRLGPTPKRLHDQPERLLGLPRRDGWCFLASLAPDENDLFGLDGEKLGHGHAPGCWVARLRG